MGLLYVKLDFIFLESIGMRRRWLSFFQQNIVTSFPCLHSFVLSPVLLNSSGNIKNTQKFKFLFFTAYFDNFIIFEYF